MEAGPQAFLPMFSPPHCCRLHDEIMRRRDCAVNNGFDINVSSMFDLLLSYTEGRQSIAHVYPQSQYTEAGGFLGLASWSS